MVAYLMSPLPTAAADALDPPWAFDCRSGPAARSHANIRGRAWNSHRTVKVDDLIGRLVGTAAYSQSGGTLTLP